MEQAFIQRNTDLCTVQWNIGILQYIERKLIAVQLYVVQCILKQSIPTQCSVSRIGSELSMPVYIIIYTIRAVYNYMPVCILYVYYMCICVLYVYYMPVCIYVLFSVHYTVQCE